MLFIEVLGEACEAYNFLIHSWCQMTNHYHLLIETPDGNLSKGMRHINGVYTQRFNKKQHRAGNVFQGRFKAILVERETYLLELARYIVLNPVRAKMVESAECWPWSSYRITAGLEPCPAWFDRNWLLSEFSVHNDEAEQQYMEFVTNGLQQLSPWSQLKQQIFLGDDAFVEQVQAKAVPWELSEAPKIQRRGKPKLLKEYAAITASRDEAVFMAYRSGGYTLKEIADYYGLHYSTISRIVKNYAK